MFGGLWGFEWIVGKVGAKVGAKVGVIGCDMIILI